MLASFFQNNVIEAGCDEAGRGCLAGPVVASAVILSKNFSHPLLNDSKQVSEKNRDILRPIIESQALAWAVGFVDNEEIDQINILNASFKAMHRAINGLTCTPELLLIDGNRFSSYLGIPHRCIIKGDGKYAPIAAASVLAKTHRDEWMKKMATKFPQYGWTQNKGYPTRLHKKAIAQYGLCALHRKTFRYQ